MDCAILINIHPMVGVDWHDTLPPPVPPPSPIPSPHFVFQVLNGLNTSVMKSSDVLSHGFQVIKRGSDIGMGIGHVAANYLFPIHVLTSGSKSEFGAYTVLVNNNPVAIACLVYVNLNLNCQGPTTPPVVPLPTGIVIAPSCNMAGFKMGDFLAGLFAMVFDMALQGLLNYFGGKLGTKLNNFVFRYVGPYCCRYITPFLTRFPAGDYALNKLVAVTLTNLPGTMMSIFGLGSPVGYSPDYTPFGGAGLVSDSQEFISKSIADYFNEPSVEEF